MMRTFFKSEEIKPGVFAITGEAVVRYLIIGKTHALLFDNGYGFVDIHAYVKTLTDLPLYVVISHGHVDHAGGCCFFDGPIYMHPADRPVYEHHQSLEFRKIFLQTMKKMRKIFFFIRNLIPRKYDGAAYLYGPRCHNFSDIKEGDVFDLGGVTARVVEIPGHTPGSIGLYCKELRLFFASDGICSNPWLFLPESCKLPVYVESLKKAEKLDFDYLLTGHRTELIPKAVLKDYLDVALNPDFEHGKIVKAADFAPGVESRVCYSKNTVGKKKKASIQISADKL